MANPRKCLTLDDYDILPTGDIVNIHTGRILKPQLNGKGYLRVGIGKKLLFVHRLVAQKYVPNPNNYPQVNHKDGNKLNNKADNLEWVTNQQNRDHAIQNGLHTTGELCSWSKLTKQQVEFIRTHIELSSTELSKVFNVSARTIRDIREYHSWKY